MNPARPETEEANEGESAVVRSQLSINSPAPRIPDHELLQLIGRGSYGEVWLGCNKLGTLRAIKIVRRAAFEDARPFEREFKGIQKFEPISRSHDGLVDILQVGGTEEYFYYVMELADDATQRSGVRDQTSAPEANPSDL
jgi:serine/threonine protein kinase